MPEHVSNDRLTTAASWPGFHNDPLRVGGDQVVLEPADMTHPRFAQPANTVPCWAPFNP